MIGRVRLPVYGPDRSATTWLTRRGSPPIRKAAAALGWAGDARVLLSLGMAYRLAATSNAGRRRRADHLLAVIGTTTILHHLVKRVVDQQRPDRTRLRRQGQLRSKTGRALDAFPSGHAMHAGALASALSQIAPRHRGAIWPAAAMVAAARVVVLAHWPTGVLAGFLSGIAVERLWRAGTGEGRN